MFKIKTTNQFEKDSVKCIKRNYDFSLLQNAILLLESTGNLPSKYRTHRLSGKITIAWNAISNRTGC